MPQNTGPIDPERYRQLMIKTKTCQRLEKECAYYLNEVKENEEQLNEIKADPNKDEYDVKRFQQVLDESYMMVPDSKRRFNESLQDLEQFLETNNDLDESCEWYCRAKEILNQNAREEEAATIETNVDELIEGEVF